MTVRLWRVAGLALVIALAANVALWPIVRGDDTFARVIAVASGVAAVVLIVTRFVQRLSRFMEEGYLLALAVWLANLFEFTFSDARAESKIRQGGFYLAFAIVALGLFLAAHIAEHPDARSSTDGR